MSSIYVLEPPTKGKVIVNTTHGPLDIELWPKEAPKAVRNFLQLCLEGYFDNTVFHRIIKGFLVQGGDPTASGTGEVDTDKDDRPLDPLPKILSVEVLWNPFEDIVPRMLSRPSVQTTTDADNKDTKKKAVKKLNLLSFGDEAEEEEKELAVVKQKIKSSHDVLDDPRLLKDDKGLSTSGDKTREVQLSVREALSSKKEEPQKLGEVESFNSPDNSDEDEANFDARMRRQILRRRQELGDFPAPTEQKPRRGSSSPKHNNMPARRSNAESIDDEQPRVEKLSLKKKGIGSEVRAERLANADADLQLLGEAERGRQLQKQKKRRLQGREDEVLAKLEMFTKAITGKANASSNKSEGSEDNDVSDWKTVRLKFAPEHGKDNMSRKDDPNDYVVHDPLLEKGKEKFNRMQAKQKRREREWAGKSLT